MNRHSTESTDTDTAHAGRGRGIKRLVAITSAALGLVLLAPHGATSTSAAGHDTRLNRPVQAERFETAVRRQAVQVGGPLTPPADVLNEFAVEVVRLTNIERAKAGVGPVQLHPNLMQAADVHAKDIAGKACRIGVLSHIGSDGSNAGDRIFRTGLSFQRWGENIACAHKTPEAVVAGWMRSDGHRANLLDPRHTHIGVDVEKSASGLLYWVQNFAVVN